MGKQTFAIYCSDGASRVIKFYSDSDNLNRYKPQKVIYDGDRHDVVDQPHVIFGMDFIQFNEESLIDNQKYKIKISEYIHNILDEYTIGYLLCFGNKILSRDLVDSYKNKIINFHPSVLPSFKGLSSIDQALSFGTAVLGNTAHFVEEKVDSGKIIIQTVMLAEDFTSYEDVLELQFPMMRLILRDILLIEISDIDIEKELTNRKKPYLIPKKCLISHKEINC